MFKNYLMNIFKNIKSNYKSFINFAKENVFMHKHRILTIERDEGDNYIAVIQIINKNKTFRMNPENILASDELTNSFSPIDIRTLTYLGYLGINGPKYKILAKRLSETDNKLIYAIHQRGNKHMLIKTANEISSDFTLISGLHQKEAHMIGFETANEQFAEELQQKQKLLQQKNN